MRELKRKGISISAMARYLNLARARFDHNVRRGQMGYDMRCKLAWLLKGLEDGNLVCIKASKRPDVFALAIPRDRYDNDVVKKVVRCRCGRYTECPCDLIKPAEGEGSKCQYSLSGAAIQNAVSSMTRLNRSRGVPNVEAKKRSGFRSG